MAYKGNRVPGGGEVAVSKVFGIPLPFILLVAVIILPLLVVDLVLLRSINEVKEEVITVQIQEKKGVSVPSVVVPSPTGKQVLPQKSTTSTRSAER